MKLSGYGQSPKPLIEDKQFESFKNDKKQSLKNIKKNLELKLKNMVKVTKKPWDFRRDYEDQFPQD